MIVGSTKHQLNALPENDTENAFLPHSQNSQDTPKIAQQRRAIIKIQQKYRLLNWRGETHLQTPLLYIPDKNLLDKGLLDKVPPNKIPIPSLKAIPILVLILFILGQAPTTTIPPVLAIN